MGTAEWSADRRRAERRVGGSDSSAFLFCAIRGTVLATKLTRDLRHLLWALAVLSCLETGSTRSVTSVRAFASVLTSQTGGPRAMNGHLTTFWD